HTHRASFPWRTHDGGRDRRPIPLQLAHDDETSSRPRGRGARQGRGVRPPAHLRPRRGASASCRGRLAPLVRSGSRRGVPPEQEGTSMMLLLGGLAGLVLLFVLGGFALPRHVHVERSTRIEAGPEAIYPLVASFSRGWVRWTPFADPGKTVTFDGPETGVGAT